MKNVGQNNHKFSFAMLLCSSALMLLCSAVTAGAAELPKTAKLLPPETIVLVDIHDFSKLQAQFENTSLCKLYKDPAMAAFFNNFKAKWQEMKEKSDNEFARIAADAEELPQGRAAIAVVLNEQTKDANEPPALFIAEWGSNVGKIKETVGKIVDKLVEDGARVQSEDYRGVGIKAVTAESSSAFSYCFIDDCMIGSMNPETLKFVIAQVKGAGSPTLADDSDYNACLRAVGPPLDGQVNVYVNIRQIVKMAAAEDAKGQAKMLIANLGLDNVTSFGFSLDLARGPGGSSFGKALLKIDGGKKGIFKMLEVESGPITVPRFVSGSSSAMSFVNLNIGKAYDELANIVARFSPQFAMMLNMPLLPPASQGEPPVALKNGIIDHLGSQIIVAQSLDKPAVAGGVGAMPAPESLVAIATNNRNALEKSLSLLHGTMIAPNNPGARRELLGHTIYLINLAGLMPMLGGGPKQPMQFMAGPGAPQMPQAAFTVTDTHLIIGAEAVVEQAIRTLGSSQADSVGSAKWFAKAKASIPSAVGLAGLQDNAASGEYVWSAMREAAKGGVGGPAMGPGALPQMMLSQVGGDLFDFGLLPEFDAVRKYFGLSAFYGISREDGYFFEFKYLNSDGAE